MSNELPMSIVEASRIPDYFPWACVAALIFPPTGIVGFYYAVISRERKRVGDDEGAAFDSKKAKHWCLITPSVYIVALVFIWIF